MRVKRSVTARNRHKKILKLTKGMGHTRRASYRKAHEAVLKALSYAYRDRRTKKRDFRSLWITRINAATREYGISYNQFIAGLKKSNIDLDRKTLAQLAVKQPEAFKALVEKTK
ncbi:50S ribosomal protein L20 [Candidatus Saccharibacteria bacterium]|nr:50S ribosomal protein L20 [Candidatus Saccharibacteria bacterium]